MPSAKLCVAQHFLHLVANYVALKNATVVTLGGKGIEAKLWQELNIDPNRAWLIERNRDLSRDLIQSHPFHYCGSLTAFPGLFRSANGSDAGVDGFHLDLCGTIEPRFRELQSIFPLVKKSAGRCLAITVAEGRRNLTLERFQETEKGIVRLLHQKPWDKFFAGLLREQEQLFQPGNSFTPEKGARREAGVFANLVKALTKFSGPRVVLPDVIERYVYVSRYSKNSFRMRTYFFHLGTTHVLRSEVAPRLAEQWRKSKLFVFDGAFKPVSIPLLIEREESVMASRINYARLEALANAAGGEALEQFVALKKAAENPVLLQTLAQISQLAQSATANTKSAGSNGAIGKSAKAIPGNNGSVAENHGEMDELEITLNLVRGVAEGNRENAYATASQALGLTSRKYSKTRQRIVGGKFACTQGKFRKRFVSGCVKRHGYDILPELAGLYTKITGQTVTETQLRNEVSATK